MSQLQPVKGLVSIVVASYNHADFLKDRMDSLINQTYPDIEIIVIDDCSTDDSRKVLYQYEGQANVQLINREQNGGWVEVSNQGLDLANGEFVIFANCDDACEHNLIEELVKKMRLHPSAGIAFSKSFMIDENSEVLGDDYTDRERLFKKKCKNNTLISSSDFRRFLMHSCVIPNLSAALFRKDCLDVIGYFSAEYKVCCDWDLFFRISTSYDVAYCAKKLNRFRQHSTTVRSSTKTREVYAEFFRLLLTQLNLHSLSFNERCIIRIRVMDLWVRYLLQNPISGLVSFKHHLRLIWKFDACSLMFFPMGLMSTLISLLGKVVKI